MPDRIDSLLRELAQTGLDCDLSGMERAVWARVDREGRADAFAWRSFSIQIAAACGALLLGFAISHMTGFSPMPRQLTSELVVLSDDAGLAPSVRLEGGV